MALHNIIKKGGLYYLSWFIPSSTPLFYLFYEKMGINVFVAYFLACVIAGTLFIPIYYYIFTKHKEGNKHSALKVILRTLGLKKYKCDKK